MKEEPARRTMIGTCFLTFMGCRVLEMKDNQNLPCQEDSLKI
jgi:hypothetical protein